MQAAASRVSAFVANAVEILDFGALDAFGDDTLDR
jgi:hypothetical protein